MSTTVWPLTQEVAQALLEAAEVAGHSPDVVAATSDGFVVPDDVADIYHHGGAVPESKPRRSRKSAQKE